MFGTEPDELRGFRKRVGLTQSALADRVGVTPLTVHRWETGQSRPQRIAKERLSDLAKSYAEDPTSPEHPVTSPESRPPLDFGGRAEAVSAVAEALRLAHGHQFNPVFASETARIDPLPHQRIAVYERMLKQDPLRFLLADDAGAGKTIMTGLIIREMLLRGRIRRVLIVPPAGLVGNWKRELELLFRLNFRIVSGADVRTRNPFQGPGGDLVVVSLDTLRGDKAFSRLCDSDALPYDLVVFDEAHKLSVSKQNARVRKTRRYQLAEALAGCSDSRSRFGGLGWSARHLLLLTATPHMGKAAPYYFLWRLIDPVGLATEESFKLYSEEAHSHHFIRRTKEEMVGLDGSTLFPPRECLTFSYDLSPDEQALYDATTDYLKNTYGRALSNRPAIQLAMGVFQRRLASSTWALLRSFERRIEKLHAIVEDINAGRTNSAGLRRIQEALDRKHNTDYFDTHSADEDTREDGIGESHEDYEDAVLGAIVSIAIEDLEEEISELSDLRERAVRLYGSGRESKFEKLREVVQDLRFINEKCLIFTEHRDTAEYLVRRLEALGFSGQVGTIHGGMDWREREDQVSAFREPSGNRFLVATDAAGEGINLQFCRMMLNYDIPWNPARLEQRMGRIHRYGQKYNVQIINFVAGDTYEGRVLQVLLEKLETIRKELSNDKVFDVIGRLFENVSLGECIRTAYDSEGTRAAIGAINEALSVERIRDIADRERKLYGPQGDVAECLDTMRTAMERERYLQLLPAYVRRLILKSADLLEFGIRGDIDSVFSLVPKRAGALDWLLPVLEGYAAESRERLSVHRPKEEACVWLHPGEPVFDALSERILCKFSRDAQRGSIFVDPRSEAAYMLHLVLLTLEEDSDNPSAAVNVNDRRRTHEQRLTGLIQGEDGSTHECEIERLLLLWPSPPTPPGSVPVATQAIGMRAEATRYVEQSILKQMVARRRNELIRDLPDRLQKVKINYQLRGVELADRRNRLSKRGAVSDQEELEAIKQDQRTLKRQLQLALEDVSDPHERLVHGNAQFLVHALAIPPGPNDPVEQYDERVEDIAITIARAWEEKRGATVQDVSKPELARALGLPNWPGFDLISKHSSGETRNIEVKGRGNRGSIQMAANEWKQACNLGPRYWLYVVLDCATVAPQLVRVNDPFRCLLSAKQSSYAFTISTGQLLSAADRGS